MGPTRWHRLAPLTAPVIAVLTGCAANQGVVAETASPADSAAYAEEWPAHVEAALQRYQDGASAGRQASKNMPTYAAQLVDPDWAVAREIYEEADRAGRSHAVVEALRDARRVKAFHESSERELSRRIVVHVNAVLKNQGCDCEYPLGPSIGRALGEAVDEELTNRYRELNEAHRLLEEHGEALGDENVSALETQADAITATSFFVFVDAPTIRDELGRLVQEGETVSDTLEKAVRAERATASDPNASRAEKQAAEEHLESLEAARQPIATLVERTEALREEINDQILELRESYRSALDALLADIETVQ